VTQEDQGTEEKALARMYLHDSMSSMGKQRKTEGRSKGKKTQGKKDSSKGRIRYRKNKRPDPSQNMQEVSDGYPKGVRQKEKGGKHAALRGGRIQGNRYFRPNGYRLAEQTKKAAEKGRDLSEGAAEKKRR